MTELTIPYHFIPRDYQLPIFEAIDNWIKRIIMVRHRRAWKDKACFNIIVKKAMEEVWIYYYVFPTYSQWKKAAWDGIDKDGWKTINHIPKEIIKRKNDTEMKVELINGSIIQIIWSDNVDSIVWTNPIGIVFSEYSLQSPAVWDFLRPILAENGWWAIFNFTPRWDNHAKELLDMAKENKDWMVSIQTVDDTKAISKEVLESERQEIIQKNGSDAIFQQEYYCSFDAWINGSFYAEILTALENAGRRTTLPYDPALDVFTVWDLGINDSTAIRFWQRIWKEIRVIDHYENSWEWLSHYVAILKEKPYRYWTMRLPHDAQARSLQTWKTVEEKMYEYGFNDIQIVPKLSVLDWINSVRAILPYCWFDKEKTERWWKCLKNYHKELDEKRQTFKWPEHDWSSHSSDAFRYLAVVNELYDGTSQKWKIIDSWS